LFALVVKLFSGLERVTSPKSESLAKRCPGEVGLKDLVPIVSSPLERLGSSYLPGARLDDSALAESFDPALHIMKMV
jgi:hypothetical protein